ncbi:HAMP domain-containing protein [Paraburkholderia sp. Tr-20389]|uniref:ATP-binding protein n=1 Tax=Paraburkholderia sp. Tr-20389 TaxID=2703903 RepID=UPI001981FD78|nr:ATP-binding protein [Paraburkholderia sp. Tr-20389]MBN3753309.1 HAMP domain-containing protein [Paraburkholderia sp. Tr-20389]
MKLHLWPDSLFGRLVTILAVGMFAGQLLTSTIWFDTHDNRTLEIPARLFASRLADTVRLLQHVPDAAARDGIVHRLADARYRLQWIDTPQTVQPASLAQRSVSDLISGVVRRRLGEPVEVRVIDAEMRDEARKHKGILSLFDSRMPTGDFHVQMKLPDAREGVWLDVQANEGQAGMQSEPGSLVVDYLVRIYLIRFVAICLLAFVAVRFAVQPLRDLAKAADALGRNIYRPPLPVSGPLEVRSAAMSFNSMQRQLTESLAERTRFLTAVSHDLRSPLTRLRLRTEMLPDAQWRERLRGDLDDMEAMVRATLDAVQGIEVTEDRRDIDLDSMLEGLAEDARDAGHMVTVEGSAARPVAGFPRNLKRCLQNLLDNAIFHGGEASIHVTDDGRAVRVAIRDNGPGIPDEAMLARVFEPYFRGKAASGGTGLGLTIAQSIAATHGGTLTLRNRTSGGLEAELILPRES